MQHPELLNVSCSECKLYIVDIKKGTFLETKDKRKQKRPANTSTPCWECPKQSPSNEHNCELSERNIKTLELYYRFRACGWDGLPSACRGDSIVCRNFSIIDKIVRQHESRMIGYHVTTELLPFLIGK